MPSSAVRTHQITWTDAGRIANYCPSGGRMDVRPADLIVRAAGHRTDIECTVCFVRFCMVRYGQIW